MQSPFIEKYCFSLALFHVEHTFCSYLCIALLPFNIILVSLLTRIVCRNSKFFEGGGSFSCYLTFPQSEPPPLPYFPKPKTPIVPRGTHNLFIFKCLLCIFLLFRKASVTSSFLWGGGSFSCYLTSPQSEPPPRPCFPKPKTPIVPRGTHILFISLHCLIAF